MADLLSSKISALKKKIETCKEEIKRLDADDSAGRLSPIEKMRLSSLKDEHNELVAKLKELAL
ncbi:MAG: hypothetical protein GY863_22260 [bacterium]|nr:hypothetical protein [bacterium]